VKSRLVDVHVERLPLQINWNGEMNRLRKDRPNMADTESTGEAICRGILKKVEKSESTVQLWSVLGIIIIMNNKSHVPCRIALL
jgi:hypothetical protein